MSGYVIANIGTAREQWATDFATGTDLDELRKRRLEEHDIENDIPVDWDSGWNA